MHVIDIDFRTRCLCRMAQFVVRKVRDGGRLGELVVNDKCVSGNRQTPMCMLYTRGGENQLALDLWP